MHTYQCIHLCQSSFMPNGVLLGTSTSARGRVLGSLAFCVICSCTWASTCMEPALVNLCSQWSPVVHMHVDPSRLLQCHSMFEHSFWVIPPLPFPFFHCIYTYYICDGCPSFHLRGGSWLGCQDFSAMREVSSRSWLPIVEAPECLRNSTSI